MIRLEAKSGRCTAAVRESRNGYCMSFAQTITFTVRQGPDSGKTQTFNQLEEILIGKDPRCDFVIDCRGVSRMHCKLEYAARGWTIVDLKSTNGVLVGDKLIGGRTGNVDQHLLANPSEHIRVGEVLIEVLIGNPNPDKTEVLHFGDQPIASVPLTPRPNRPKETPAESIPLFERTRTSLRPPLPRQRRPKKRTTNVLTMTMAHWRRSITRRRGATPHFSQFSLDQADWCRWDGACVFGNGRSQQNHCGNQVSQASRGSVRRKSRAICKGDGDCVKLNAPIYRQAARLR